MADIRTVLFLGYPSVGEQDLIVPLELFRAVAWTMGQQGQAPAITLGTFEGGTVAAQMGTRIESDLQIVPHDRFDLVYVPGGIGAAEAGKDETVLEFIRAHHDEGRWVAGNCAGVGVMHRAGVLDGVVMTAAASIRRRLTGEGIPVTTPRTAWTITPERKLFTAGGAAVVHPSTIALVWHLFGDAAGRGLAEAWDTLPLHGEGLFSLDGPVMRDDPETVRRVQDTLEDLLLHTKERGGMNEPNFEHATPEEKRVGR